ncbi:hypothetical protein K438DRAFT_1960740 [Mycena galopus ATCC 62051]|nr:hypothetical protein K438DRAFT_1960740 [Mycena galopus ATCC 62051]
MERNGIAIIGIAAQLPSGSSSSDDLDYASFWDFLSKGETAYEPLENVLPDFVQNKSQVKLPAQGAFLKNATGFDNIAFGISARDARVTPYSARRLLDLSFQALLDSGIESRGQKIGCFMSGNRALQGQNDVDADGSFSWMQYSLANRISYTFDLTGPSVSLDTACSSSLTALHLAIGSIERGDCTAALVGAAQINRDPFEWTTYVQGKVLSPQGVTKPFDNAADGFSRGEGGVVIVLKPLKDAIRDNDHIYSIVVGSAISATGSHLPLNVPNGLAQQECIRKAYSRAGLSIRDVDYVELHATGTSVGDPIETNAACALFASDASVTFGSVKGNIGCASLFLAFLPGSDIFLPSHLEVAAFLASLVKACLIFEHGVIPPTANFLHPSRTIAWDAFHVVVPVESTPLGCRSSSGRSIISLSASGLGGATGHVVLQSPPPLTQATPQSSATPVLFLVGGISASAVDKISHAVSQQLDADLPSSAVTLSRRARQLPWRTYFTMPLSPRTAIPSPVLVLNEPAPIAFVFSGQGPQNLEMGRQLFAEYPVFRNTILELDAVFRRVKGVSFIESTGLFSAARDQPSSPTIPLCDFGWPVAITVSSIAMIQMALFDLLKSVGIIPDMLLGHSAGETAILYASGAGPKEMAMEIAIARGEAMTSTEGPEVGMAMLACSPEHATKLIGRVTAEGVLELSCFNTPTSIAVSGTAAALDEVIALGKSEGLFAQRIRTMVPGHSSFMDPIKDVYLAKIDDIFARYPGSHAPGIPVFSTCRDERFVETFSSSYFWDNCRNAVLFSDAVSAVLESSPIFLEVSCHPVLSSSILQHGVADTRVLCPMRRISAKKFSIASTETATFLDTLGRLSLLGVNSLDLSGLYGFSAVKSKLIDHPLTARVIPPPKSRSVSSRFIQSPSDHGGPLSSSNLKIHRLSHPDLMEHVINGEPILPATGFIELLLEANANFLWDVEFISILSLGSSSPLEVGLQRMDSSWSVTTSLASGEREHAHGFMDKSQPNDPSSAMDFNDLWERLPSLDCKGFYSSLEPLAAYGPRFQRVVRCHGGPMEAIAEITGPTAEELAQGYLLNPVIMDACLHVILHTDIPKQYSKDIMYLPSRLDHFIFYRRKYGVGNWFSHIQLRQWTPDCRYYDILVTDSSGTPLAKLHNLMLKKFTTKPISVKSRFDSIFQPVPINVAIPLVRASFPEREKKAQIRLLYDALDSLALDMLSRSLSQNLVFGEDESRRRYLAFARRALENHKDIDLAPDALQTLRETWPQHFEITTRIAAVHESVFDTPKRAVDALYSDDLMAKFYSRGSQTSDVCLEATETFSGILGALRRNGKRFIKILEVGAGTGLLTYHLIDELKRNPDLLVEYTVTDISYALVANLARNMPHRSIIAKAYDISKDPDPQGIHAEAYDLVVSLHVLHTAPNVGECLTRLQDLLVPGGCLLTVELDGTAWAETPGTVWFDCIFGSFPEWFGPTDGREHCTMTPNSWKQQLEDAGFVNVQTCVEHGGRGHDFFFVAQRSLTCISRVVEPPPDYSYVYEYGNEIELQTRLSVHDPAASATIYLLASRGRNADAAIGLCAALTKETPLWDVRLAIFESPSDMVNPAPLLSQYARMFESGENVVVFDQRGCAHVPRVVLSPPPPIRSNIASMADSLNYITVRATSWAGLSPRYDAFVGEIEHSHSGSSTRYFVGGIAEASSARTLRVHRNNIVSMRPNAGVHSAREILLTILTSMVASPSTKARLAVALENPDLAKTLGQHLSHTMPQIQVVAADFADPNTYQRLDVLFTDIATSAQYPHLRRWIPQSGRMIVWDQLLRRELAEDPSYMQRILASIQPADFSEPLMMCHRLSTAREDLPRPASLPCNSFVPRRASPPFRPDRVYALLGGIGGLGVDLAVWMYQHGARHLVLTSRRGLQSFDPIVDSLSLAKVTYLKGQDDLDLRMEACDATDAHEMGSLLRNLSLPLAGCFHMALVLSDETFFKQTQQSFKAVHDSKLKVFDAFATHVDITSLDFVVAFSSVSGLVGLMGQSNYASACTALDGILAPYPNAFSLITPGISDAGYLDRTTTKNLTLKHLTKKDGYASMSAEALWACLEDGLRKLDDVPFNQYIPDMDWDSIDTNFTLPRSCRHLISPTYLRKSHSKSLDNHGRILDQVLDLLEVSPHDFDATQPLAVYGLDSLSAAKLSAILRPYGSFSQMQLLGGVTWSQIENEIQSLPLPLPTSAPSTPSLVEICPGSGIPLIILPGGNGSIALFYGLRPYFRGALWALQITDSTPLETFNGLVAFWKHQICAKRPHGPYRFAAYSASTLFGVALTKAMEDSGEEVLELTFIDHCPALWLQDRSEELLRERTVAELHAVSDESVLDMLRNDPSTGSEAFANYDAALRGMPDAPANAQMEVRVTRAVMSLVFHFLHHFYPDPDTTRRSYRTFRDAYSAWLTSVKARRLVVLVAEHGIVHSAPGGAAADLGANRFPGCMEVHHVKGAGHYGLFRDQSVARILDDDHTQARRVPAKDQLQPSGDPVVSLKVSHLSDCLNAQLVAVGVTTGEDVGARAL